MIPGIIAGADILSVAALFANGEIGDLWHFNAENTDATTIGDSIRSAIGLVNGLELVQVNPSRVPTLQTDNGKPCARFDGSSSTASLLRYNFGSTIPQPGTIIIAAQDSDTSTHALVTGSSASLRWQMNNDSSGNLISFAGSSFDSLSNEPHGRHVYMAEYNGASSRWFIDGVLTASGNPGTQSTNAFVLGGVWDQTFGADMDCHAALFIDRILTDRERKFVTRTMGLYSGLSITL